MFDYVLNKQNGRVCTVIEQSISKLYAAEYLYIRRKSSIGLNKWRHVTDHLPFITMQLRAFCYFLARWKPSGIQRC